MAICNGCGAQIEDGVAFCPDCGKKQEQTVASTEQASTTTEQTNTTAQANTTEQTAGATPEQVTGSSQEQTTNAAPEQATGSAQGQSFATGAQQPGNGFAGNGQYNTQNQFGGQNQYGNQNQFGGQNQYGNQNQYGGQNQYGNNMNGGYAGPQQGGYAAPEKKDKLAAGLLGLFLGTLGIHKFYLGYSKEGLIMLLTSLVGGIISCGIATFAIEIIALVEGVMYLTKSDEEFYQTYVVGHKGWF